MPDYKEMYLLMVRETEKAITSTEKTLQTLIDVQRRCEEMYINAPDPVITLLRPDTEPQENG